MTSELITEPMDGGLAVAEQPQATDLRHSMMTLPVQTQNVLLAEYTDRRNNFRTWLMNQMERGVHYGVPPGCEPKGNPNPDQWQAQPSLYAAGADLLCDLLGLRAEFIFDQDAWVQFGSKPGYLVVICRLYSRATKECIGEGRGARKEGQKGGDANNAVKMAQKSAKVDAILNGYGLRDVFTQDLENPPQPPHENPEPAPDSPIEQPRAKRQAKTAPQSVVTQQQCADLLAAWRAKNPNKNGNVQEWNGQFGEWVRQTAGRRFDMFKAINWLEADYIACDAALSM